MYGNQSCEPKLANSLYSDTATSTAANQPTIANLMLSKLDHLCAKQGEIIFQQTRLLESLFGQFPQAVEKGEKDNPPNGSLNALDAAIARLHTMADIMLRNQQRLNELG